MTKPIGVYIHIPFCTSKCPYCNFYSRTLQTTDIMDSYSRALTLQTKEYSKILSDYKADTVYFGGGTPTVLGYKRLSKLLSDISKNIGITDDAEITFECNPDSSDFRPFSRLRACGFNRISIGIQSADDTELDMLGRTHDFRRACLAVKTAKDAGFDNISVDLMYGIPGSTVDSTLDSVRKIVNLNPSHISTYALKLEKGTPMYAIKPELPEDDRVADMYLAIVEELKNAGYEQYEISNFAKDGKISRHNSKYWDLSEYIGLGASAHSYFGKRRYSYISDIDEFIERVRSGDNVIDSCEEISDEISESEYIMLRLRTAEGVNPEDFSQTFKKSFDAYRTVLESYIPSGHVCKNGNSYRLTPKGFFVSNSIIVNVLSAKDNAKV